ncbi:amino acid ABC transporter substrate-binding protein, partial [Streptomyces niveus]
GGGRARRGGGGARRPPPPPRIRFAREPGISVWQATGTPVQVVDRDPAAPDRFRILRTG